MSELFKVLALGPLILVPPQSKHLSTYKESHCKYSIKCGHCGIPFFVVPRPSSPHDTYHCAHSKWFPLIARYTRDGYLVCKALQPCDCKSILLPKRLTSASSSVRNFKSPSLSNLRMDSIAAISPREAAQWMGNQPCNQQCTPHLNCSIYNAPCC